MKMSKKIKRALFCGASATIITVLLGLSSTMAWFQDTETLVNVMTFGDLKVDICVEKDADVVQSAKEGTLKSLSFVKPDGGVYNEGEYLFEPGATFKVEQFYVKNIGNVPFTYRLSVIPVAYDPDSTEVNLMDSMDVYVTKNGETVLLSELENERLVAEEKSELIEISFHMREDAGNEYNANNGHEGLIASNVKIDVFAWQDDYMPDSLDTQP